MGVEMLPRARRGRSARRTGGRLRHADVAARVLLGVAALCAHAGVGLAQQALPSGGQVTAGSASIQSSSGNSLVINQTSPRAVVNWNSFSIGAGNSVNFVQPGATSAILNRVTGTTGSDIAGRLSGSGQVFLVNPNGIAITPTGAVSVGGGFVASTLGISTDDFMNANLSFSGDGTTGVFNQGLITAGNGGFVGLVGGRVSNEGRIAAPLGRVGLGAGAQVTLDLTGDGFLQVLVPSQARDVDGRALIEAGGDITAEGGLVVLRAATVRQSIRDVVNVPGRISAQSASGRDGHIILGGAGGNARVTGRLDGGNVRVGGDRVAIGGTINARNGSSGGSIAITAVDGIAIAPGALIDASGSDGGLVAIVSDGETTVGGRVAASGSVRGGRIDITGRDVALAGATVDATGTGQGGAVRIGGAFRGGAADDGSELFAMFIGRYGLPGDLAAAESVTIDAASVIAVSADRTNGSAGAVVVWSERDTRVTGRVVAQDASGAGAVEISSRGRVAEVDLGNLALGAGSTLLLDPMNIIVQPGGADPAGSYLYDGAATDTFIDSNALSDMLVRDGISVVLEASNEITIGGALGNSSGGFATTFGDLTLRAGRGIGIFSNVLLNSTGGGSSSVTLIANDANAVGPRDFGEAEIVVAGRIDVGGDGDVTVTMNAGLPGQEGARITLGEVRAGSITITQAGNAVDAFTTLHGDLRASGDIRLTGALVINPSSFAHLEIASTSGTVAWVDEATHPIAGREFPATVAFREAGQLTRFGLLEPFPFFATVADADATRLAVGPDSSVSVSRTYGDDNSTLSGLAGNPLTPIMCPDT